MRTLALIPARAGSKGIEGKNLRPFAGEALPQRAVRVGYEAGATIVALSTESQQIRSETRHPMPTFYIYRPDELARDDTPMLEVVKHAASCLKFDVLLLLQPTQPLRKPEHVMAALKLLEETGADAVVSVVQIPAHYSPDYACRVEDGQLRPYTRDALYGYPYYMDGGPTRRQDARKAYSRDGTVYAIRRKTIENGSLYGEHCVPLIIPSHESVNLDTEEDWQRAEAMVKR